MTAQTLLVGATDFATLCVITDFSGILAQGPTDQEFISIPGRQGAIFVPGEWAAYSFGVPVVLVGDTLEDVNENLRTLVALLDTRAAPVTLTRRIVLPGAVTVDETCSAAVSPGWAPKYVGTTTATLVIDVMNLDGVWTVVP